ncbi:MAG: hypothetical protein K0R02_1114 [Rickettsiaceae bacterium]|jgi:Skp family chaperone for outer membrane proteins|nr:hypothetical protein [Rickettsiaceae bacterium]
MNKFKLLIAAIVIFTSFLSIAAKPKEVIPEVPAVKEKNEKDSTQQYQKVIEEYKKYLQSVPKDLREEVKNYRTEMVRLNNEKRELYKKLSNQAQEFLKKEREYKKKLPLRMRKELNEHSQSVEGKAEGKDGQGKKE